MGTPQQDQQAPAPCLHGRCAVRHGTRASARACYPSRWPWAREQPAPRPTFLARQHAPEDVDATPLAPGNVTAAATANTADESRSPRREVVPHRPSAVAIPTNSRPANPNAGGSKGWSSAPASRRPTTTSADDASKTIRTLPGRGRARVAALPGLRRAMVSRGEFRHGPLFVLFSGTPCRVGRPAPSFNYCRRAPLRTRGHYLAGAPSSTQNWTNFRLFFRRST